MVGIEQLLPNSGVPAGRGGQGHTVGTVERSRLRRRTGRRGFTLIELLVAIVILAVLTSIAVPTYQRAITSAANATTEASLQSFASDLRSITGVQAYLTTSASTASAIVTAASEMPTWTALSSTYVATNPSSAPNVLSYDATDSPGIAGYAVYSGHACVMMLVSGLSNQMWTTNSGPCSGAAALSGPAGLVTGVSTGTSGVVSSPSTTAVGPATTTTLGVSTVSCSSSHRGIFVVGPGSGFSVSASSRVASIGPIVTSAPAGTVTPCSSRATPVTTGRAFGSRVAFTATSATPGTYTTLSAAHGATLTLSPGVYVITQSFSVTSGAKVVGNGVTLVFTGSAGFYAGSHAIVQLNATNAPTVAVWYNNDAATFQVSGASNVSIGGSIYAPQSALSVSTMTLAGSLVAYSITESNGAHLTVQ